MRILVSLPRANPENERREKNLGRAKCEPNEGFRISQNIFRLEPNWCCRRQMLQAFAHAFELRFEGLQEQESHQEQEKHMFLFFRFRIKTNTVVSQYKKAPSFPISPFVVEPTER